MIFWISEEYEDMKPFMSNYKMNLVQAADVDLENFRTDLKFIFSAGNTIRWNGYEKIYTGTFGRVQIHSYET